MRESIQINDFAFDYVLATLVVLLSTSLIGIPDVVIF